MKYIWVLLIFICGCGGSGKKNNNGLKDTTTEGTENLPSRKRLIGKPHRVATTHDLADGINLTALKLIKTLAETDKNKAYSPTGINWSLFSLYAAANNETKEEIRKFINARAGDDVDFTDNQLVLAEKLFTGIDGILSDSRTSLWIDESIKLKKAFADQQKTVGNIIKNVDLQKPETMTLINKWIKETSRGLIDKSALIPNADSKSIVINTIYFKAQWSYEFKLKDNRDGEFNKAPVTYMNGSQQLHYFENAETLSAELDYTNKNFSMILIMPKNKTLKEYCKSFNPDEMEKIMSGMNKTFKSIMMPKFEISTSFDCKEFLKSNGITKAFSIRDADLTQMTEAPIYVDQFKQRTVIKVNEKGTEAASVTERIEEKKSERSKPIIFDKPFLYLIMEKKTGTILFLGQFTNKK